MVLVEEFTGVQCVNCPQGHVVTAQLLDDHPDNVAVIAMHNYFAGPFSFSHEDYEISEATTIDDFLGPAVGWPAASIDRFDWGGNGEIVYGTGEWVTNVNNRLSVTPPVNVYLESDFNDNSREMIVTVTLKFNQDVPTDVRFSLSVTESGIVDAQQTPSGIDTFYVHEHVLRDMISPATGFPINVSTPEGRVIIKQFSFEVPEHWDEDHCEVVGFVHRDDGLKTVLQAAKTYVID